MKQLTRFRLEARGSTEGEVRDILLETALAIRLAEGGDWEDDDFTVVPTKLHVSDGPAKVDGYWGRLTLRRKGTPTPEESRDPLGR